MTDARDDALHPSLALVAYASGLLAGRRVAVIGDSSRGLAERAATASQRQVHAYDPVAERVAAAIATHRGGHAPVSFAPLDEARSAHRAAFDVVIIDEVDARGGAALLDVARELLSPQGLLVAAAANPDAAPDGDSDHLGYYDFYDLVAERFDEVHMLGLAPFVGFTLAEFALEGEPTVTIDTSLVSRTEEPRAFVALASARAIEDLDPYAVVQMPLEGIADALVGRDADPASTSSKLAELQLKVSLQQSELERLRERERQARSVADEQQQAATALSARLAELASQHEKAKRHDESRIGTLEQEVADRREQAEAAREELRRHRQERHDQSRDQDRSLEERERALRKLREQLAALEGELGDATRRAEQAERRADKATNRSREERDRAVEGLERRLADAQTELERLRRRDKGRDARVRELEAEVAQADDLLASKLEEQAEQHQEELDAMLDRIAELEDDAEDAPPAATGDGGGLNAFQAEELRRSLAEARRERDEARAAAARGREAEGKLADLDKRLSAATAASQGRADEGAGGDVAFLEKKLADRARQITVLEQEVREAERVGRELVRRLGSVPPRDDGRLRELAQRCSKCEADLRAAQWKITALEEQAEDPASETDTQVLEDALRRARAEVAELRRLLDASSES